MKSTRRQNLLVATLVCALVSTSAFAQGLPTTGTVQSPIGALEIKNGYPTDKTVTKLYDALDFQRATQAYIWALPYMAMTEWQRWTREEFGAGNLGYVDYVDFKDKLGILTANATTPYTQAFPNLAESGPLVFEFPPGALAGGLIDFWQRPIVSAHAKLTRFGGGLSRKPNHPDRLRCLSGATWSDMRGDDRQDQALAQS